MSLTSSLISFAVRRVDQDFNRLMAVRRVQTEWNSVFNNATGGIPDVVAFLDADLQAWQVVDDVRDSISLPVPDEAAFGYESLLLGFEANPVYARAAMAHVKRWENSATAVKYMDAKRSAKADLTLARARSMAVFRASASWLRIKLGLQFLADCKRIGLPIDRKKETDVIAGQLHTDALAAGYMDSTASSGPHTLNPYDPLGTAAKYRMVSPTIVYLGSWLPVMTNGPLLAEALERWDASYAVYWAWLSDRPPAELLQPAHYEDKFLRRYSAFRQGEAKMPPGADPRTGAMPGE